MITLCVIIIIGQPKIYSQCQMEQAWCGDGFFSFLDIPEVIAWLEEMQAMVTV